MGITANQLTVEIFADGADKEGMLKAAGNPLIKGFKTNPTLMRKAGIADYEGCARHPGGNPRPTDLIRGIFRRFRRHVCSSAQDRGVGAERLRQDSHYRHQGGERGTATAPARPGASSDQRYCDFHPSADSGGVRHVRRRGAVGHFSLRRTDCRRGGRPPAHHASSARDNAAASASGTIWANPREVHNVVRSHDIGCHIITVTADLIAKPPNLGKDLTQFSLETVKMFRRDASARVSRSDPPLQLVDLGADYSTIVSDKRSIVSGRRPNSKISLIFPIGERTTNNEFRAFTQVSGTALIKRAWQSFVPFRDLLDKVYFICLKEDERRFYVSGRLRDFAWHTPYEAVVLDRPTSGPAETVARGVEQCAISGRAIVCDVDHRLQLRPFFQAIASEPTVETQVCVWPLKGENLKRWSVGCLSPNNRIREVAERRLPASSGSFYGVLGCYYFSDISAVAATTRRRGFARFSEYFNHQIAAGASIAAVHLDEAEFFGDVERIREIEATETAFRGAIFCDIDGTILEHEDIPDYAALSRVLPGSREKLTRWTEDGYFVILCTARPNRDEELLTHALRRLEIPFHRLVMGLPSGPRIVINDRKPYAMFTTQATSLEITRNQGIGALELPTRSAPTVLRRFEGGSFAETLLLEERELLFVRKRASKHVDLSVGYLRLKTQFRTMERFSHLCPAIIPELFGEQDNSHEYYYDMEFLAGHAQLSECRDGTAVIALDALMEQFDRYVYCHRNAYQPLAHDWFLNHLQSKIYAKMDRLARNPMLRPLIFGEGLTIDGAPYRSLDNLMSEIADKQMDGCFRPQFLSLVHGDMTFQNIMVGEHGSVKAIDMEATDGLDAIELDLGKLFQSIHSQYDTWSLRRTPLCEVRGETEIELKFKPGQPDPAMLSSVCERWSAIMNCSRDLVDLKGGFFLGLHLVRMTPFRLAVSDDQAIYALATGIQWLSRSLDRAGAAYAPL